MKLIKITEEKTKLVLSSAEAEKYISKNGRKESVFSLTKLLSKLEKGIAADIFSGCIRVGIRFPEDGGCEITVKKDPLFPHYSMRTFVFDKDGIELARSALGTSDYQKYSSLYLHEKSGSYIWEIVSSCDSPLPSRLADFGRECTLSLRKDFLSSLCKRLEL